MTAPTRREVVLAGGGLAVGLAGLGAAAAAADAAAVPVPGSATAVFQSVNGFRRRRGRRPLRWGPRLAQIAQDHATHMAETGVLHHNELLTASVPDWELVGENVGVGPAWWQVTAAFRASQPHRALMLERAFRWAAAGVARGGGRAWVCVVFRDPV